MNLDIRITLNLESMVNNQDFILQNTVEKFQKKILNERIARLSGGIAIIQVGAQTVIELKDKQLRVEDALNATKVANYLFFITSWISSNCSAT